MKQSPVIMLAGTILAVTIASAVLYASARPAGQVDGPLTVDRPIMLPQSSDRPSVGRTALQAAAYVQFQGLFGASQPKAVPPVSGFLDRIAKKPFGIYITPDTSPVQGDHFTGYHTGVDAEFTDTNSDIPVYAIADGTIIVQKWAKGYGGVIVIRHIINGVPLYALYGHVNVASFGPANETHVTAGQQIAILGADHSEETDGVRKHLHFSLSTTDTLDLRGYVLAEEQLTHWLNPLDLFSL